MDSDGEILRLRDRVHGVEGSVVALEWQIRGLQEWRGETRRLLDELAESLDGIVKQDELADALAARMRRQHTLQLTILQKVIAGVVGLTAFADAIRGLVS